MGGYHQAEIPRGELGQISKITEEYLEFMDANAQGVSIMELVELSDLVGAIKHYVAAKYNMKLSDLIAMQKVTERAFQDGTRQPRGA